MNSVSAAVSHEVVELRADPIAIDYVDGQDDWMYAHGSAWISTSYGS